MQFLQSKKIKIKSMMHIKEENSFASGMRVGNILNHLNSSREHPACSGRSQPQSLPLNKSYAEHIWFLRERRKERVRESNGEK